MKKKIIALIMVIPLVFMFTIFSASKIISIGFKIPASSIEIKNKGESKTLSFDMAEYLNDFYLDIAVLPYEAENRSYDIKVENQDTTSLVPIVDIDKTTGKVKLRNVGKAKVSVTSFDGGFKDSVMFVVNSSKIVSFEPKLYNIVNEEVPLLSHSIYDYQVTLPSGKYLFDSLITPPTVSNSKLIWTSSDQSVIDIDKITGASIMQLSGTSIVTGKVEGVSGQIERKILVHVEQLNTLSGITINGQDNLTAIASKKDHEFSCLLESSSSSLPNISGTGLAYVESYRFEEVNPSLKISVSKSNTQKYLLHMTFTTYRPASINLIIQSDSSFIYQFTVSFEDLVLDIINSYQKQPSAIFYQKLNDLLTYYPVATPKQDGITYEWQVSKGQEKIQFTSEKDGLSCDITALSTGEVTLNLLAYDKNHQVMDILKQQSILIVEYTSDITSKENAIDWGIANEFVMGNKTIRNKNYVDYSYQFNFTLWNNTSSTTILRDDIIFTSSDASVAQISVLNGKANLSIFKSGIVSFTAKWKYQEIFQNSAISSITLRVVKDAVVVNDYDQLMKASEEGKEIILNQSIMLGKKDASKKEVLAMAKELKTTWDWTFYKNEGLGQPSVHYLVEFKNNVYGNGYEINGEYITKAKVDSTTEEYVLFNGPLNFVSMQNIASVKAQDNIVFLVRTDGVILDNVSLLGCSDSSLYNDQGEADLTKLNNVGTTLEIMSNARIINSRIRNGRTTLRAFGRQLEAEQLPTVASVSQVNATQERIKVEVESCILTQAREYLVKIGTNRSLSGTDENISPSFYGSDLQPLKTQSNNYIDQAYFYDQYVLTDFILKNSVLAKSGLFAIGIEAHFAGPMLMDQLGGGLQIGWKNLASTSFPAILRLQEDVRIYDWKNLSHVDSSTLIETTGAASSFLKLQINKMMEKVATITDEYKDILDLVGEEKYVHGGIVFYGGGKNYSQLDTTLLKNEPMAQYLINMSILAVNEEEGSDLYNQGQLLPLAAGEENFRFYLYHAKSTNNYYKQVKDLASGSAYDWIPKAKR